MIESIRLPVPLRALEEFPTLGKILVIGIFGPEDIVVEMSGRGLPTDEKLMAEIEEKWAPQAAKGAFPGPLVRLESYSLSPEGKLHLVFGKTNFKEFLGTRDEESLRKYGWRGIANPLSSSAAILTGDGKMLVALKKNGSIDAIGGYAHPEQDLNPQTGKIDIFRNAIREVVEETGIREKEIPEAVCLGLCYEYKGSKLGKAHAVASFGMKTSLTAEEILRRKTDEEINVAVVSPFGSSDSEEIEEVIARLGKQYPMIEPDGRITFALAKRWLSGKPLQKQVLRSPGQV